MKKISFKTRGNNKVDFLIREKPNKCIGFFAKDELTQKAKIRSLTANNERILSIPEDKTFPSVPVSVLVKKLGIVRRRVLEKYCPSQPRGNSVYRAGVDDFAEELKKELGELK